MFNLILTAQKFDFLLLFLKNLPDCIYKNYIVFQFCKLQIHISRTNDKYFDNV